MLAYDFFGIVAAAIGAYSASRFFYSYVMGPLVNPLAYITDYGEKVRWGRTRLFFSCLATNLLFFVSNLTVLSYIQGSVDISAGNITIFSVVGGGLIYRLRLKKPKERKMAFRIAGSYCGAFIFAFFAKISFFLFSKESQLPFRADAFTTLDLLGSLAVLVAISMTLSTLGEFVARRRKSGFVATAQ